MRISDWSSDVSSSDLLAGVDMRAGAHRDSAHMAIARGDRARMFHPHEIAVPAVWAGKGDRAVGGGMDRRAVAAADIDPVKHPRIAQDRVAAPSEASSTVSPVDSPPHLYALRHQTLKDI